LEWHRDINAGAMARSRFHRDLAPERVDAFHDHGRSLMTGGELRVRQTAAERKPASIVFDR
jgi:hypothetical protein